MGLGVALPVLVAIGSIYALHSTIGEKEEILFDEAEDLIEAVKLEETFERKSAAARAYLLAHDVGSRSEYDHAEFTMTNLLAELRRNPRDDTERELLAEVDRTEAADDKATDAAMDHAASPDQVQSETVDQWVNEVMPLARVATAAMDEFVDHRRARFERARRTSRHADRRAAWVLGATVALALLLSALGGAYLVRSAGEAFSAEQRKRNEAEERRAFIGSVLDQLPLGVVAAESPSRRIFHVSEYALRILRLAAAPERPALEELAPWGTTLHLDGTVYRPEDLPLARALTGEVVTEEELRVSSGRILTTTAAPIRDEGGHIIAAVVAFLDVTERKRGEEERELFLGALGHDLRNPLAAILLASNTLARRRDLPEGAHRAAARIASAAERMNRVIEQLLDFARSQRGAIPLNRRRCDLVQLVRDAVADVELGAPDRPIRMTVEGDVIGEWDGDRLGQVVQNLLWNALEYGSEGAPIDVHVGTTPAPHVEVTNRGEPIPPEIKTRMFEPFRRGGKGKGLGLGLFIVRTLVEAHGGQVSVDSDGGVTRFRFELPAPPTTAG